MDLSRWLPELINHVYWDKKEQFLFDQDTYMTWILFAVEEGTFEYRIEDDYGQAGPGDIVLCPPHIAFHRKISNTLSFHSISFDFTSEEAQSLNRQLQHRKLHVPLTTRLSENFMHLRNDHPLAGIHIHHVRWKQHYFLDLWLMMMYQYPQYFGIAHVEEEDSTIRSIALYIEQHAHQSFEIKQVASEFGITHVQLIRRFKAVYHMNPLQYLTSIRIKKACSMLLETDWKLDVIASHCGYENGYYLSRLFTKHMGS